MALFSFLRPQKPVKPAAASAKIKKKAMKGPSKRQVQQLERRTSSYKHDEPHPSVGQAISQRLSSWVCDPQGNCEPIETQTFTNNMPWRIFRIMAEFVEGFEFLSRLKSTVTFFGSARAEPESPSYKIAVELGRLCALNGYTVITGGGPGIMEAGNKGAVAGHGTSIGLNISLPMEQRQNPYVTKGIGFHYFFTRKVMLSASAQAYVYFPGGFGTFDELFEIANLIETKKMATDVPIILIGKKFWSPLLKWIKQEVLDKDRYIDKADYEMLHLVDSADEAFKIIKKTQERVF